MGGGKLAQAAPWGKNFFLGRNTSNAAECGARAKKNRTPKRPVVLY
jgi:hypothetical protein